MNERRHVEDVQNHESHERSVCILYGYQSSARYKTASPYKIQTLLSWLSWFCTSSTCRCAFTVAYLSLLACNLWTPQFLYNLEQLVVSSITSTFPEWKFFESTALFVSTSDSVRGYCTNFAFPHRLLIVHFSFVYVRNSARISSYHKWPVQWKHLRNHFNCRRKQLLLS